MDELIKLMELWKAKDSTQTINQIKDTETFIYSMFFAKKIKGGKSNKIEIPIKRGSGTILSSVSPGAEHLIQDMGDFYLLDLTLPRFPLQSNILAHEINEIKSFDTADQKTELATIIGENQASHKSSFLTTLEYMSAGALFGKVMDGKGNILFEFKDDAANVEFKSNEDPIVAFRAIDKKMAHELGKNSSYIGLASDEYMDKLWALCVTLKLDDKKQAQWIDKNNRRCLEVYSTVIYPYTAIYKNLDDEDVRFIPLDEAVFVPTNIDAFATHHGRADHIEAVKLAPTQFFSVLEPMPKGAGYYVLSETKSIPICDRPSAIIKAKWVVV